MFFYSDKKFFFKARLNYDFLIPSKRKIYISTCASDKNSLLSANKLVFNICALSSMFLLPLYERCCTMTGLWLALAKMPPFKKVQNIIRREYT